MSIEVSNLSFGYDEQLILNDISFSAEDNELLSILGPNGVGKSTLFRCILGLLHGYKGQVSLNNLDIKKMGIKEMAKYVAYIPQSHYPLFNYSVFDMVLMGTTIQISTLSKPGKRQIQLAEAALDRLEITHLKHRGYTQISGGERQLVLIARALVQEAKILILDEPTANLDFGNQIRVQNQIKALAKDGYTVVQSTHNPDQTFLFSDKVLAMKEGKVLAYGQPNKIYSENLIKTLYGVDVEIQSFYEDQVRVCIPKGIVKTDHLREHCS
ncbi:ABC-type cobalamin/Fe3+-siderophore transport system, ATPase component [Desulfitobacterium dehalogenans ATCC 51507]|uniref:ABC-type cobalamin/Fe3+-siderophore transport system, ATPase component n=1 Tax=Desulfitobacterium dehalogenans (strain ATCC 51507 / DSM 9161 / JW/IU-DC1) TaxID=756499 RepID=I4AD68_DESDJ|nr:ABC transporter ATP-binding protein [Desulfitobacterium dehalogenans]AFM01903.1 ABC-type cobalamin/Fe3+-siderophore transport system, ATPase component [Desulfitobacterium dehalogenans ATCC 51507]